jgi:hypothetical protein
VGGNPHYNKKLFSGVFMDKNDTAVLFPEVEICNIKVKPWTFGVLFKLAPILEEVIKKAESKGIVEEITVNLARNTLPYTTLIKLFTLASEDLMNLITITTGNPREDIEALSMEDGMKLVTTMWVQNKSTLVNSIKNALSTQSPQEEEGDGVQE